MQSEPSRYARRLDALFDPGAGWHDSWNIGPLAPVLGVRERDGARVLSAYSWGLLPGWARDPRAAARCFNARAETVASKPTFRSAFRRRRLLVPVDGFYEWAHLPGRARAQPHFFSRADGDPVVLAGLWEWWARDGAERLSAAVITCPAGPDMPVHDRQPVVLEPDAWERWLDPDYDDPRALESLLRPSSGVLVHHAVSPDVGSVRNDGPRLVLPLGVTA